MLDKLMPMLPIAIGVVVVIILLIMGYLKAPPDTAYIISGLGKKRILIGRAGWRVPFFERVDKLSLRVMQVDVRTTDAYTNEETLELLRGIAGDKCTLVPRSTRLGPSAISPDHPLVRRLGILGKEPFGSPTLSDQALMPFPSLKIGPGDSARSHTADEYIEKWELRDAIQTYITLLDGCHI